MMTRLLSRLDVVEVRGNSEGAISFGVDGCGVIGNGVCSAALVCRLALL